MRGTDSAAIVSVKIFVEKHVVLEFGIAPLPLVTNMKRQMGVPQHEHVLGIGDHVVQETARHEVPADAGVAAHVAVEVRERENEAVIARMRVAEFCIHLAEVAKFARVLGDRSPIYGQGFETVRDEASHRAIEMGHKADVRIGVNQEHVLWRVAMLFCQIGGIAAAQP